MCFSCRRAGSTVCERAPEVLPEQSLHVYEHVSELIIFCNMHLADMHAYESCNEHTVQHEFHQALAQATYGVHK